MKVVRYSHPRRLTNDSPERFCKLGAEVRFGSPRFVDDHTVDLDGAAPNIEGTRAGVAPAKGEGEPWTVEEDVLLVAAGRKPNVEGLDLPAAGVNFSPRGIPADSRMRTNVSHIYSCGDVNGVFPFTHVAGYEAGTALSNAVLRLPRKADYTRSRF